MSTSPYYNKIQVDIKVDDLEQQIANVADGTAGKAYPNLTTAMSITPLPEDGVIFTIDETNEAEKGVYRYDSTVTPEGYAFVRHIDATGVVEEGNAQAVSGGEVFRAIDQNSLISSLPLSWMNGYISRTGTWNNSSLFSYCEIDVSELDINKKILVSTVLTKNSSVRMIVFVDEENNVILATDQAIDIYNYYIPESTVKMYINSNRNSINESFFYQKKEFSNLFFTDSLEFNTLQYNTNKIRLIFNPILNIGYMGINKNVINNVSWRYFEIDISEIDPSAMLYFKTFETTSNARAILFFNEMGERISVSDIGYNEYYSYIPPNTKTIVCNVPFSKIDDFIFSQNKVENYLAKKDNMNKKNAIYSWWIHPLAKRVYIDDNDFTFFGYVANTGEVSVGRRDNTTGEIQNTVLRKYTPDDHNACCVEIAEDGSVIVAHASGHSGGSVMYLYKSVRPYDISEFNYNSFECGGMTTYSQLVKLSNKTAWFYRHNNGGLQMRIITDDYTNVSTETQLSIGREYALFRKNPENDWILCIGTPHPSSKQTVIAFYIDIDAMVYRNVNGVDIGDIANGLVVESAMEVADASVNTRLLDVYPKSTSDFNVLLCRFNNFSTPFDGVIYSYEVEENIVSNINEIAPQGHPMYIGSNYVGGGSYMQDGSILIANNNNVDKWELLNIKDSDLTIIDSMTKGTEYSIGRPYESLDGQIIYHKGFYENSSYESHATSMIFKNI